MVNISDYDFGVSERYAKDRHALEAYQRQFPPAGPGIVAGQTRVLDFVSKPTHLDALTGVWRRKSWAIFPYPPKFHEQRLLSPYAAPSLGPTEKQDADIKKLETFLAKQTHGRFTPKPKEGKEVVSATREENEMIQEGRALIKALHAVKENNTLIDYVYGRMLQFVQA